MLAPIPTVFVPDQPASWHHRRAEQDPSDPDEDHEHDVSKKRKTRAGNPGLHGAPVQLTMGHWITTSSPSIVEPWTVWASVISWPKSRPTKVSETIWFWSFAFFKICARVSEKV